MTLFDRLYEKLMIVEGAYANHPKDRGGMTFCGISRVSHPSWPGWFVIDRLLQDGTHPSHLKENGWLMTLVREFYRDVFWDALRLDDFPAPIAAELFDSAVNCGKSQATLWLQHAMNLLAKSPPILQEDGVMGPKTIGKVLIRISNFGYIALLKSLNGQQYMHYQNLVEQDPSQRVFFRGWLTRVWEDHHVG